MLVMPPMVRDSTRRSIFQTAHAENREDVVQPCRADQAAMGQHPMKAQPDPERAENIEADERQDGTRPTEKPRHERKQRKEMNGRQPGRVEPTDAERLGSHRSSQRLRHMRYHHRWFCRHYSQ